MALIPRTPMHPLRTAGKVLLFSGVFMVGMAMLGAWQPYTQLQGATFVRTKVLANNVAFHNDNGYAFHLRLAWQGITGEERTQITSFVKAPDEEQARRKYRGKHLVAGQEYEFPLDPQEPSRILPFTGYNWRTFGQFIIMALGGLISFGIGMYLTKKGQALQKTGNI